MVKEYNMELWEEFENNIGYGCGCCGKIYLTENEAWKCKKKNKQ